MGNTLNVQAWSTASDTTNGTADAGINFAEGQTAGSVNNSMRATMAAIKRFVLDLSGAPSAVGGTANAHTVTTNQAISSGHLTDGFRLAYYAPAANTSTTVTVAVDGLTAKNIKRCDGSALTVGCIKSDMLLDLVYEAGVGEFRAVNLEPLKAAFSAHKNGSAQAVSTTAATKITFGTELFDDGGYFDAATNYRWTPPAGVVVLAASALFTSVTSGSQLYFKLYKNGSSFKAVNTYSSPSGSFSLAITVIDQANGTDYYEMYVESSDSAYNVNGVTVDTWFMGSAV